MTGIQLPAPNLIGAPARYTKWRHMQMEAVVSAAESTKRFVLQGAPTGFGKSLAVTCLAKITNKRTVILTSTKALMTQYEEDQREAGMIEIKGLNAYECVEGGPTGRFGDMRREGYRADRGMVMMCDEAPCQAGAFCPKRDGGCLYYDAYRRSLLASSKLIVTNYAYYMSIHKFGDGLGPIDILVLDEAHNAVDELGGFIGTELRPGEMETAFPSESTTLPPGADQHDWIAWANHWAAKIALALDVIRAAIKGDGSERLYTKLNYGMLRRSRDLKRLQHKVSTIANMQGEWIIDYTEDERARPVVKFDPVWPGEYAQSTLFMDIPKVVMISATVRPKTAEMLGIAAQDVDFKEYPSTFPKQNRPIIYIPTAHMNRNSAAAGMKDISTRIDQIVGRRLDRKALIQTVSYKRAKEVYAGSDYQSMMLIHDSLNTKEVIAEFKRSRSPLILVSPVLDTGYDFPYEQAEYQIIVKVPFPVTVDKVVKARTQRDPEYRDYVTMVTIVQMAGRIVRAEDDMGETFILDSDFGWWYYGSNGKQGAGIRLSPNWFNEAVRYEQVLGTPLPKLVRAA